MEISADNKYGSYTDPYWYLMVDSIIFNDLDRIQRISIDDKKPNINL